MAEVNRVDTGERYFHVRVRDPSRFSKVRTLTDASYGRVQAARSCGAHGVKVGKSKRSGDWWLQSVLVHRRGNSERSAARKGQCTENKIHG